MYFLFVNTLWYIKHIKYSQTLKYEVPYYLRPAYIVILSQYSGEFKYRS